MEIDVLIEATVWEATGIDDLAEAAGHATLGALGLDPSRFAVSLLACDDDRIATLNADFRGKPTPTNVLSWPSEHRAPTTPGAAPVLPEPLPDGPVTELGDIALAHGTCAAEAAAEGRPFDDHVSHLVVHGLLHCLGYDHETDPDAARMEALETRILASMGIPDPY